MRTVIGIDYGTGSARAVLADVDTGETLCTHTVPYDVLPGDLADIRQYESALWELMQAVTPEKYRSTVAGICVDATSLTLVVVGRDGVPLARHPQFADREQAQVKLWKRHTAQEHAEAALDLAKGRCEPFLSRTGGSISAEWTLPKLLEIRTTDEAVFSAADLAFDLNEYLTCLLLDRKPGALPPRSTGSMCFKGLWARDLGFPSRDYLDALAPGFGDDYPRLLRGTVLAPGDPAGVIAPEVAKRFRLPKDVVIAAGILDGHTSTVALGALAPGDGALVVGTSNVLTVQTETPRFFPGICGIAADGLTKGLYGIDAGQNCTGDMLSWYVTNAVPASVTDEARQKGISVHDVLTGRITTPWDCPLTAVDWLAGSRNAPCDLSLRGQLTGLSLSTRPEDIYLALLQAIVCGTGEILDLCRANGVPVTRLVATGGITEKNPVLMQQYADLLDLPVSVGQVKEGPALGAAMLAAVAAGSYPDVAAAYRRMGVRSFLTYTPDTAHRREYAAIRCRNHALRVGN